MVDSEYMLAGEVIELDGAYSYEGSDSAKLFQGTIVKIRTSQLYVGKTYANTTDPRKEYVATCSFFVKAGVRTPQIGDEVFVTMRTMGIGVEMAQFSEFANEEEGDE